MPPTIPLFSKKSTNFAQTINTLSLSMKRYIIFIITLLSIQILFAQSPCATAADMAKTDSLAKAGAYADSYTLLQQEYDCAKTIGQ